MSTNLRNKIADIFTNTSYPLQTYTGVMVIRISVLVEKEKAYRGRAFGEANETGTR